MTLQRLLYIITSPLYYVLNLPLDALRVTSRLKSVSVATLVAILLFLFLVILEVTAFVCAMFQVESAESWVWFNRSGSHVFALIALPIVIPLVVRLAILYWMEPEVPPFPDIDSAWQEGIETLKQQGILLTQTPLYLITGVKDRQALACLTTAAGMELVVPLTPAENKAPLYFFATSGAAYIGCVDCAQSSRLANQQPQSAAAPSIFEQTAAPVPNAGRGTAVAFAEQSMAEYTIDGGGGASMGGNPRSILEDSTFGARMPNYGGTMDFARGGSPSLVGFAPPGVRGGANTAAIASLPRAIADTQSERLAYLCKLIRKAREPYCPANGVMALLPYSMIVPSDQQAAELSKAVKSDLDTLRQNLHLRCPVIGLVSGMEAEPGFCELKRRLGRPAALNNRFGKGFTVWNPPVSEQLEAVTAHACAQFEDWTYTLFRQKSALTKTSNGKLYALLCKIRTELRQRIINLVLTSFAYDPTRDRGHENERLLFGGLYFGAAGEKDDMQGFVKSVFDKLVEQEEEVDWTPDIVEEDNRYWQLASLSSGTLWVMLLLIAGMVYYLFGYRPSTV